MQQGSRIALAAVLLSPGLAVAQVSGKPTGQCYYGDERGWVQCGDYPAGNSSTGSAPTGPSAERLRQQGMLDAAGQLGAAIGAAIGRQLSGEADRAKAQNLNNQAVAAAGRGEWHMARSLTLQALRLVPDDAILKRNLAFCDREIAEAERLTVARGRDQERARQEAEAAAAARRREEIAQNLQGQLKLAGDAGASGGSPWFKSAEPDPALVAAKANSLPFKAGEDEQLRDALPSAEPPPPSKWPGAPGVSGEYGEEFGSHYLYLSARGPVHVSICVAGRGGAPLNDVVQPGARVKFRLERADLPRPQVLNVIARPITENPALDACAMRVRK